MEIVSDLTPQPRNLTGRLVAGHSIPLDEGLYMWIYLYCVHLTGRGTMSCDMLYLAAPIDVVRGPISVMLVVQSLAPSFIQQELIETELGTKLKIILKNNSQGECFTRALEMKRMSLQGCWFKPEVHTLPL